MLLLPVRPMQLCICCLVLILSVFHATTPVHGQVDVDDLFGDALDRADLPPGLREAIERKKAEARGDADENGKQDEEKEKKEDDISDEDQKILDDFFEELETIVDGSGKRAATIAELKDEIRAEYRANEETLKDTPSDSKLIDRQKLIAQHFMDLKTRSVDSDPRKMHERISKVSKRVREFRKAHPKLSRLEDFRTRERNIRNSAMRRNAFGGMGFDRNTSMLTTMKSLSATGVAPDIWAPKVVRAHPGESKGQLQEHAFTMRRLLRLRWDGEQLVIDKNHWADAFAGQTMEGNTKDVDHLLSERGISPIVNDEEQQNRQRMMRGMMPGTDDSTNNLSRIFQEFYGGSGGYSGGGQQWSVQGTGFTTSLTANAKQFRFSFSETSFPNRTVILNSEDRDLSIAVLGNLIHRFDQTTDDTGSKLRATDILDDEIVNYKAETFAELYRTQPRYVEERFFPLLEHIGIVPPYSRFDEPIVLRVCEVLKGNRAEVKKQFDAIAINLDVDEFTKRDAAYRELRANVELFFPLIYEASQDKTLSIETRARIGKLLEIGNAQGTAELDSMIAAVGLTSDPKYLTELLEVAPADARPILEAQIKSLK